VNLCFKLPRDACSASAVLLSKVVRPSVLMSLTLMYREHWKNSTLITQITRIISLWSSLLEPQRRQPSPRGTPPNSGGIGVGSLFSAENLQYLLNGAKYRTKEKLWIFRRRYIVGTNKANINTYYYLFPCRLSSDSKTRDLE